MHAKGPAHPIEDRESDGQRDREIRQPSQLGNAQPAFDAVAGERGYTCHYQRRNQYFADSGGELATMYTANSPAQKFEQQEETEERNRRSR